MKYDSFINILKNYVDQIKDYSKIIYKDKKTIDFINKMLDQKYNHTKRVVDYVVDLSLNLNMHINFEKIVMVSGLFHDIGRFKQALIYQTYNDSLVFKDNKNHGDYGYELVTSSSEEIKLFDDLVPKQAQAVVKETIKNHQRNELPKDYNYHLNDEIRLSDPNNFLSGTNLFNKSEKIILSVLLQMVRDADRMDILYQRSIGEIIPFSEYVYLNNNGSVSDLAKRWGVSEKVIKDNNSDDRLQNDHHIIIPRDNIPVEKLFVDSSLIERMKRLENIDLRTLQKDDNYTFITALWWSIYTFLKDMNFVGNLKQIEDRHILDRIYVQYPEEYQPLIDEIFSFAKDILIKEQIDNNSDILYVRRKY